MGAVYFYHLTRTPLEATLPRLLERSLQAGWRVVVRGGDAARIDWLDRKLWEGPEDSFLPHGQSGGAHDALQPVLLTTSADLNGAQCLMAIDGASVSAAEVTALDRVSLLFDGNDAAAVEAARSQWRSLTSAGCAAKYWSQEDGGWVMKAETGSAG